MDKLRKSGGLVIIAILVIGGLCLFAVFGGLRNLLGGGDRAEDPSGEVGNLGRMYSASVVDDNGCPLDTTTQFYRDDAIYVGVTESTIPQGTTMFVRLYHEGDPIEDAQQIEADRNLDTCVWFEFLPLQGDGFEAGQYQAELIVNGNVTDEIAFNVTNEFAGSGNVPQTGSGLVELGQVATTTAVDADGCPTDNVNEFFTNESIYLSTTESFIPAGTEVYAALVYEGQVIEETQPIVADTDMETCVWFAFEGAGGDLQPGNYQAELYVNGSRAESLPISVVR